MISLLSLWSYWYLHFQDIQARNKISFKIGFYSHGNFRYTSGRLQDKRRCLQTFPLRQSWLLGQRSELVLCITLTEILTLSIFEIKNETKIDLIETAGWKAAVVNNLYYENADFPLVQKDWKCLVGFVFGGSTWGHYKIRWSKVCSLEPSPLFNAKNIKCLKRIFPFVATGTGSSD